MLKRVNLYVATTIRGVRPEEGTMLVIPEAIYEIDGKDTNYPQTAKVQRTRASMHDAQLETLIFALKSLKKPKSRTWDVILYTTESDEEVKANKSAWLWTVTQIEQNLKKWALNGWKTAAGKDVGDLWKELYDLLQDFPIAFRVCADHPYRKWILENLKGDENDT